MLAHILNHVALNNMEVVQKDFQDLRQRTQHPENKHVAALNDIFRFALSVFSIWASYCPDFAGKFLPLLGGIAALCAVCPILCTIPSAEYAQALGMAEAALMMNANRHEVICIYLNVLASMAAMSLSYFDRADRFFLNALRIAKPMGYIQPFIGHHGPLQGLVEKHIRDREPELYKMISDKVMLFRHGWTEVHNPQSQDKVTNLLTPYEFALAMMAAKGKSNQEIADYLNISINTVKAYLSIVYQKVGITKRSELKNYLVK